MPSIEEKAIFRQINYIKNKFKGVREETESVVSLLHDCLDVFDRRIKQLNRCEAENFTSLYRKLNNEFEEFQEKLIYIQASIELPSDCEVVSDKPSLEGDNELHRKKETESSCFNNSEPKALQASLCSSSHAFSTENVASDSFTEAVLSSKLTPSILMNDLGNALADFSSRISNEVDKSESLGTVTSQALPATSSESTPVFSNETFAASFQDNKTSSNIYTFPSNSTSYASINDIDDSLVNLTPAVLETDKANFPSNTASKKFMNLSQIPKSYQLEEFPSHIPSVESLSQASSHRSLSSNLSGYQSACSGQESTVINPQNTPSNQNESKNFGEETLLKKRLISSIHIDWPMVTTATITHIENPGNFWMQLDNFEMSRTSFPKEMFLKSDSPTVVEVGDFFLAPSKSMAFYLRVKVLSADANDDHVKVFFIDHGSTQNVPKSELRMLPCEAYNIPMQVINCALADISAPNGIWCYAAIRKLKEFSTNSIETHIKNHINGKYAVQLIATVFDDEFSCDIGESLCIDGFASQDNTPLQITNRNSAPDLCASNLNSSMQTSNQLSSDSGVSVTSNQPPSPTAQTHCYSSGTLNSRVTKGSSQFQNDLQELCSEQLVFQETRAENKVIDLISFESAEQLPNETSKVSEEQQEMEFSGYNKCLKIGTCKCPLHLLIPFPSIEFVEEDMILVMLSHIDHPSEFYVNMAMENSIALDELLEQMSDAYNSQVAQDTYSILLDDLKEGMFCAALFDDGNWCRVKVLDIHRNFDESRNVLVQSVDYGNKAWVRNTELRTLTPAFAKHPAFSVKCSLAAVVPVQPSICHNANVALWNEEAVNVFKSLVSFENCLTAEVCDRTTILNEDPLQVLLFDTQGEKDILLNEAFAQSGLAKFDLVILEKLLLQQKRKKPDVEVLSLWDPMKDEFNDVQNSYGVNFEDFAIDGYKNKDEEYICKYYSLRGYCPRNNCPYQHVFLAEGGVTRDQDELYSCNFHPPLPKDGSFFLIQVSAVISPSCFYAQLPFGNSSVDELDSLINQGFSRESLQNQEMNILYDALNKHYTNKPFDEITTIALSYGAIVVAKRLYDQTWHRARIIDVQDITGPAKVFYVDFGNEEWVDRKNIRQILPEFLHAPFQAIECCLYDVEPLGFEKGQKWSSNAVSYFKNLVSETIMLAHVAYKLDDTLQVSLRRTTQNDHFTVREHLVRQGFGQEKLLVKTKKPASKYIPG